MCTFSYFLLFVIVLSGDVEKNPGPDAPDILSYNEYKDCMKFYTDHLKIVHINFQNMTGKHSDFKSFVNDVDCNTIVSVSETWLKYDDLTTFWSIPDFTLFRTDRCTINSHKSKGGGVILLVPTHFCPIERADLNHFDTALFESIWIELTCAEYTTDGTVWTFTSARGLFVNRAPVTANVVLTTTRLTDR